MAGASNVDWEDMARAVAADGTPVLWLADIGDNASRRASIAVYEVNEPTAVGDGGSLPVRSRGTLTYPDGPHDAETLIVDPETSRPVVITKDVKAGISRVYRLPASGSGTLEPLAELDVRTLPGRGLAGPAWSLTGGATSTDRHLVALRSYLGAWLWSTSPGEPLATTLSRLPQPLDLPLGRQAEALSFTRDGTGVWVTAEGEGTPLARIPLATPPSTPPPGAEPPPSAARHSDGPLVPDDTPDPFDIILVATGSVVLLGALALLRRRRRRP